MNESSTTSPRLPIGLSVTTSDAPFEETWSRLADAVEANANLRQIAVVDHAVAAAKVDLELAPTRLLVFGNPALGSPIMASGRTAALDLPQKIAVWERDGQTHVAYNTVDYLSQRHGIADNPSFPKVAGALAGLAATAAGPSGSSHSSENAVSDAGITTVSSAVSLEQTWSQLREAIASSPANEAFTVDHEANSDGALPPTRLVTFGNPRLGTPFMQAAPSMSIDLPLKIIVWQSDDGVFASSTSAAFLAARHGLDPQQLAPVDGAVTAFLSAATMS